jgi:ribosomal protein RSM22 (predicted rRNA methylase)
VLPVRFAVLKRVYRDILRIYPTFTPKRVLDFGCGPATAACAMIDIWNRPNKLKYENNPSITENREDEEDEEDGPVLCLDEEDEKVKETTLPPSQPSPYRFKYTGVDISHSMLDAAKFILKEQSVDSIFFDKISDVYKRSQQLNEKFDVIVCAYTLSELANDHMKRTATQLMFELLDNHGVLIFIDKGDPIGSHHVRTARQFLLDLTNPDKQWKERYSLESEAKVMAPCTHSRFCPLEKGSWCSFSQKVEIPALYKKEEEKFSYVVMTKLPIVSQDHDNNIDDSDMIVPNELQRSEVEEALTLSRSQARIVRSPIKKRGHVVLDVCHPTQNEIQRVVLSKSYLKKSTLDYKTIKRAQWGGAIPVSECKDIRSV